MCTSLNFGYFRLTANYIEQEYTYFKIHNFLFYEEFLLFSWRNQIILLLFLVYLLIIRLIEKYFYKTESERNNLFLNAHQITNFRKNFFNDNNIVYSFLHIITTFLLIFSTKFLPISLIVLFQNSSNFYIFVSNKEIQNNNLNESHYTNITNTTTHRTLYLTNKKLIKLFSIILYVLGVSLILTYGLHTSYISRDCGFFMGFFLPIAAGLINVFYQRQYMQDRKSVV